jgi:hypothetical protein
MPRRGEFWNPKFGSSKVEDLVPAEVERMIGALPWPVGAEGDVWPADPDNVAVFAGASFALWPPLPSDLLR